MDLQYFYSVLFIPVIYMTFLILEVVSEKDEVGKSREVPYNRPSTEPTTHRKTTFKPPTGQLQGATLNKGLIVGGVMLGLIIFLLVVIAVIRKRKNKWKKKAHQTEKFEAPESEEFVHSTSRRSSRASRRHSDHSVLEP